MASGKHSWISFSLIFFISCLLGSWTHLHGNSEKFFVWQSESLPGHLRRKTEDLCPQTRQQEGVKLWPFIASGLQEQKLRLNHAQAVQAPGCSRGGIYSCLCLLIRHISLMALQPVIPCGTSSGQKGFSPTVSLLLGYHL